MRWILSRGIAPESFDHKEVLGTPDIAGERTIGITILPTQHPPLASTLHPWLVLQPSANDQSLTATWHGPGHGPVAVQTLRPGLHQMSIADLGVSIAAAIDPWHQPADLMHLDSLTDEVLVVSALGRFGGRWCDGPLARLQGGRVTDYLPSGGAAALAVTTGRQALTPSVAPPYGTELLEGSPGERIRRCLLGQAQAAFDLLPVPEDGVWRCLIDDWSLTTAVELVLARQAADSIQIEATFAPGLTEPPSAWRRLCQNLGVRLRPASPEEHAFKLPGLAPLTDPQQLPALLQALSSSSDVIPRSMSRLGEMDD